MKRILFILTLFALVLTSGCAPAATPAPAATADPAVSAPVAEVASGEAGAIARAHVEAITSQIGPREAGTPAEAEAAEYIFDAFTELGYAPEMQNFTIETKGATGNDAIESANVIAEKLGESDEVIIVGAHYDSVTDGDGADDNASSIGVMLEVAERIADLNTPYTVRFIAFGAEEAGLLGSYDYVERMSDEDIENTIAYINMDSLAAGDITYIYGDFGDDGEIRDWALDWAAENGFDLQTQEGLNPDYPAGTTGPFSDHVAFEEAGIQYAYFEATNWNLGEQDGYTQVALDLGVDGEVWHTQYDTLAYMDQIFPGRVDEHLNLYVSVLTAILTEYE